MRLREVLARYPPKDRFNLDEAALFWAAQPDKGLSKAKISGKKVSKNRLTLVFVCSQLGEKLDIVFIGKAATPRPFRSRSQEACGFWYENNEKAWMTAKLFTK